MIRRWKIMPKRTLILAAIALSFIAARTTIAADHGPSAIGSSEALKLILEGNDRFVAGELKHPHQTPSRRDEIAKGQHPFASILACSGRGRLMKKEKAEAAVTRDPDRRENGPPVRRLATRWRAGGENADCDALARGEHGGASN